MQRNSSLSEQVACPVDFEREKHTTGMRKTKNKQRKFVDVLKQVTKKIEREERNTANNKKQTHVHSIIRTEEKKPTKQKTLHFRFTSFDEPRK